MQFFFQGGVIETVASNIVTQYRQSEESKFVIAPEAHPLFFERLKGYFQALQDIGVGPPFFVFMSFLGCKNTQIQAIPGEMRPVDFHANHLDRNEVILPEVLIEDWEKPLPEQMKPLFDSLWNAFGFAGSSNFHDDGSWKLQG